WGGAMVSGGYRVGMHIITSALRLLEPRVDDDLVDRLHYLYTSTIIFLFAILVSAKQYAGHPIECFVPAQFTRAMEQYTENYCWVQNTYWVPFQDLIPHRIDDRERRQIGYYQWVPFALAIASLMFHMPATVWRMLATQSGLNMSLVVQLASQEQNVDPIVRDHAVEILTRHIDDALKYQRDYGSRNKSVYLFAVLKLGKVYGAYVSIVYLFVKGLHFGNVVLQFVVLNNFLETSEYPLFGGHVLYDLLMGREWRDSGKFPRVTLCDFEIRVLGNVHRHTVQCVLVINMFTEKIFVFLWLWLLLLSFGTAINLVVWTLSLAFAAWRHSFVTKFLECESDQTHRFVHHFLRPDGVFLLHMIAAHAGNIMCARLTESLWMRFLQRSGKLTVFDVEKGTVSEEKSSNGNGKKPSVSGEHESWHEPSIPPPMPLLSASTHSGKYDARSKRDSSSSRQRAYYASERL
uniref:Innexin n=1 Tax=Parascaris univalens TaxID=6257 RepID=A0A915BHZ2_PARUN